MNITTLPLETFEQLSILEKQNVIETAEFIMQSKVMGNEVTYYKSTGII